ncbi:MAG: hypothetical protein CBCREVIR_3580, partial [Candidatus Burkholderia crenata]
MMKLAVTGLILTSSALVAGCVVYPDGTPAYVTGSGYSAYPAYPAGYEAGYGYGAPVVQSGVIIDGGGYYGGPGPRYWNDGPGYRRPPPGGWGDRGGDRSNRGGNWGGDRGGHGGPQAGAPQGGRPSQPLAGKPGRPAPAPQAQQSRGSTPYVGRSLWGKPSTQQPEHNH